MTGIRRLLRLQSTHWRRTSATTSRDRGLSTAIADLKLVLPGAGVARLPRVQELMGLVLHNCLQINPYQADGLLSTLTGYLVSNTRLASKSLPPIVIGPSWSRLIEPTSIRLTWSAIDTSSMTSYDLWVRTGTSWTRLVLPSPTATSTPVNNVYSGRDYVFALRAPNASGVQSAWSYMSPCLTCR